MSKVTGEAKGTKLAGFSWALRIDFRREKMDIDTAIGMCDYASHLQTEISLTEDLKKAMRITIHRLSMLQKKNVPAKHKVMGVQCYCPACEKNIAFIDKFCKHCGQALIRY